MRSFARASRPPLPPVHASSSASSSDSHSHSNSAYMTRRYRDGALSGSETERESQCASTPSYSNSHSNAHSYGFSSLERPSTPASVSVQRIRERCTYASSSPTRQREPSPGPSHGPRQRVLMVSATSAPVGHASHDVTSAALAAVATRSLTVRDITRGHQTCWPPEDISTHPDASRRQPQLGGSAESSWGAGGRLVDEGLRAPGIGMRNGNQTTDNLFGQTDDPQVSLRCARTTVSNINRTVEWEDKDRITDDRSRASGSSTRHSDGVGPSARPHLSLDRSRAPPIPRHNEIREEGAQLPQDLRRRWRSSIMGRMEILQEKCHFCSAPNGRSWVLNEIGNLRENRPRTVHFLSSKPQLRLLHQKGHVAAHSFDDIPP
ncbi:hypothetical protein AZE42_10616 [Rhizopogon vesiculosus]|uniref:Uncharacterized protein n=1 Tax=Rhizopogon vesiculosus TaxID=180088 RepID=A0A1J8Q5U5_9AGAM|nr:hypothetical protein AZE42_10616 [Rhizopogon vesiculosus]